MRSTHCHCWPFSQALRRALSEISSAGTVADCIDSRVGVRTATGEEISADAIVLCGGANVAPLAWTAGVYMPVQPLCGYSLTAKARRGASVHAHLVFSPSSLYVTRLGDDIRFTCFGEMRPVEAGGRGPGPANPKLSAALRRLVEAEVPNVRELVDDWDGATEWHGARPMTPDCCALSGATRVPRLYVNCGHSFNGWREATLSARVVGDILEGGGRRAAPKEAHGAYRVNRFQVWPAT